MILHWVKTVILKLKSRQKLMPHFSAHVYSALLNIWICGSPGCWKVWWIWLNHWKISKKVMKTNKWVIFGSNIWTWRWNSCSKHHRVLSILRLYVPVKAYLCADFWKMRRVKSWHCHHDGIIQIMKKKKAVEVNSFGLKINTNRVFQRTSLLSHALGQVVHAYHFFFFLCDIGCAWVKQIHHPAGKS